jgi:hypothetical protein
MFNIWQVVVLPQPLLPPTLLPPQQVRPHSVLNEERFRLHLQTF